MNKKLHTELCNFPRVLSATNFIQVNQGLVG